MGEKRWPFKAYSAVYIFNEYGEVLMGINTESGSLVPPGGGIEQGEDPRQAALREAQEETGATVRLIGLIGILCQTEGGVSKLGFPFLGAFTETQEINELEEGELASFRYVSPHRADELFDEGMINRMTYESLTLLAENMPLLPLAVIHHWSAEGDN